MKDKTARDRINSDYMTLGLRAEGRYTNYALALGSASCRPTVHAHTDECRLGASYNNQRNVMQLQRA
jgi:hypothetical protein